MLPFLPPGSDASLIVLHSSGLMGGQFEVLLHQQLALYSFKERSAF
jgi:hypothetical protein